MRGLLLHHHEQDSIRSGLRVKAIIFPNVWVVVPPHLTGGREAPQYEKMHSHYSCAA